MVIAWLLTAIYYSYQYVLRSAPAVMMPELAAGFGVSATAVASMLGLLYYGYSPFSLVAGVALDRLGPRRVVPIGAVTVGVGALLFATGNLTLGSVGRFLQGAGGVFALVGAVYIATTHFPASRAVFARLLIGGSPGAEGLGLAQYQSAISPMLIGVGLALVLTLFLNETGAAARRPAAELGRA
jgi:MFS family permease